MALYEPNAIHHSDRHEPWAFARGPLRERSYQSEGLLISPPYEPQIGVAISTEIQEIKAAIAEVQSQMEALHEIVAEKCITTELSVVPGLSVQHAIPITVEEGKEQVVARWVEISLLGFGSTESEAIMSLMEEINLVWKDLHDGSRLSNNTKRMLKVMEYYVAP